MSKTPQWVLDKIEEVKVKGSTELDLSAPRNNRGNLDAIPIEIYELTFLKALRINYQKIREIPQEISHLQHLSEISIRHNKINEIPESISQLKNLVKIDLRKNKIQVIPEVFFYSKKLTSFSVNGNKITTIPNEISHAQSLTHIDFGRNLITYIPDEVAELKYLEILHLGSNNLRVIPDIISCLSNLKKLNLNRNQIKKIPHSLFQISSLQELFLNNNQISIIPEDIAKLSHLYKLDIANNSLLEFPKSILNLEHLSQLYIDRNRIPEIPESITYLKNLENLNLCKNQIQEVPEAIAQLPKLEKFDVRRNPIEVPPPEIVFEQGLEGIRNYYKQIREEGIAKLYEAKLLIVGEAGAGKTTLANKILDQHYELQPEDTTHGIDIHEYIFSYRDNDFRVNIWDFGGQEIYHATHRFFLTERSLYILVANERKEDTDFDYWLNIIQLLGKKSPAIILLNEKFGRKRKINENALRGQFRNIKEIISLDLSKSEEIPKLVNKIQAYLQTLDHIGDPLPKTWTNLRTFLETDGHNYITIESYLELCDDFGFKENTDKLSLSQYLHDLGIILHFQDDPLLNKTVILSPEWATDAVYQILDHPEIIENYGTFSRKDLSLIAINTAFENMQDEVLQLMLKFQLCYRITETANNYISPQLLDPQQPNYGWKHKNNLVAEYDYEFMPKGIISRFIVVMNRLIKNQGLVWRSGVILTKDNTDAEVIENLPQRRITIRVRGDHRRNLLTIIFHELDKIHDSFHGLKVDKLIPCNCPQCKPKSNPYLFPLKDIQRAIAANRKTIECRYSFAGVDVKGLIEGIYDPMSNLPSPARDAEFLRDITIRDSTVTITPNPVTDSENSQPKPDPKLPSTFVNASIFAFLLLISLGVVLTLAKTLTIVQLAIALIGLILVYVTTGVFTLRSSEQLRDTSTVVLIQAVLKQLPLLGNVINSLLKNNS
ncbi:COR domain-containing protein [[Limnothrix rosea] IAM M-220]|uniref:COR domain-containing protein n=1 Tax=[Limnothrix rosea] IAM M-220 TaxID=454133 RepID=UPI000963940A|nr:COR domain-containing protein [[Limnothrix rosea] IAM M-220]OKH11101.1 hypothetical protein NIES208_17750 [[Limnothrix rosea] IAM M-220]